MAYVKYRHLYEAELARKEVDCTTVQGRFIRVYVIDPNKRRSPQKPPPRPPPV